MADWRDVMHARREADEARTSADTYASRLEDGHGCDDGLPTLLASRAVCLELRALGMVLDYSLGGIGRD
jgi:hypothetical protein